MKIYDISMPIAYDMPVYKGKPEKRPIITNEANFTTGNVYESRIEMNLHTGTHLDSPLHMVPEGSTIDTLDLSRVITKCKVISLTNAKEKITKDDLITQDIQKDDFILLKTQNSYMDILEGDFIYLDNSGAEYLSLLKVKGIGIDSLGIERNQPGHETHKLLMEAGIVILEGLRLGHIEDGEYNLFAAPIYVLGTEAAPVRAILIR